MMQRTPPGRAARRLSGQLIAALAVLLTLHVNTSAAQTPASAPPQAAYVPSEANRQARAWFEKARFGMFIHWGVYSVPARGEWVMENSRIPIAEYEKFAPQFDPTHFDAARVVRLARMAGMKYITITAKHHDGFAMFATRQSSWNIVDATPYKRDPLKQLADEAHRQGIKLFFYYSLMDWHHPDYYPLGTYGHFTGRAAAGNFDRYVKFMDAQLTELLTNYGPIAGIWFDGMWDKPNADWHMRETYALIHRLQPAALIINNSHLSPIPGEDVQEFEKDLPGSNTAGFNQTQVSALPLEMCDTMNDSWGYTASDKNYKSVPDLIHRLVRAAGSDANLLLNIGLMPTGDIPPQASERLARVGQWLSHYGDSIYGTRAGPISPRPWGVSTQKNGKIYVHVLDWNEHHLVLPDVDGLKRIRSFDGGEVRFQRIGNELLVDLPEASTHPIDRILVLER